MRGRNSECTNSVTVLLYLFAHHCEDEDSSDSGRDLVLIAIRGITLEAGAALLGKHCIAAIEV